MRLWGKLQIPTFTVRQKTCLFRSLHFRACRTAGLGELELLPPFEKYIEEIKKERKNSDLPVSQMSYQNMLI